MPLRESLVGDRRQRRTGLGAFHGDHPEETPARQCRRPRHFGYRVDVGEQLLGRSRSIRLAKRLLTLPEQPLEKALNRRLSEGLLGIEVVEEPAAADPCALAN